MMDHGKSRFVTGWPWMTWIWKLLMKHRFGAFAEVTHFDQSCILFRSDRPTLSQFLEVSVCCVLHETTKMGVALASLCGTLANFEPRSSDTTGSQRRWDVELIGIACTPCPFCLANAKTNSNHNILQATHVSRFLTFACGLLGKESRAIQVVHDLCFCVSVWSEAEDGPPPGFSRSWSWAWCSWRLSGVVSIVSESWSQKEMQQIGKADNEPCKAIFWMAGGPRCLAMCFLMFFQRKWASV